MTPRQWQIATAILIMAGAVVLQFVVLARLPFVAPGFVGAAVVIAIGMAGGQTFGAAWPDSVPDLLWMCCRRRRAWSAVPRWRWLSSVLCPGGCGIRADWPRCSCSRWPQGWPLWGPRS